MAWNFTESAESTVQAGSGVELVDEFGVLTAAGIDEAFKNLASTPIQGQKYFKVKNVDKNNYKYQAMNGIGLVQLNSDGDTLPVDKKSVGYDQTITNYVMRLAMGITREMLETDRYGVIGDHSRSLVHSSKKTIERILADAFNRGFGTADGATTATSNLSMLAEDGLALISGNRAQPKTGLPVWSNRETSTALTADAVATARINFRKYLDGNGDLDPQMMQKVIVPPEYEDTMRKISGSSLEVDTSLNNTNIVSGIAYEVWDWLESDKVLFMGDCENELEFHIRIAPSVLTYQAGDNPDLLMSRLRMALGTGVRRPGAWRGADLT
jgi:hypothetical protein